MQAVQCPRCSSTFDVSTLEPGSRFICGSCRTELTVPSRAHPPAALPARPVVQRRAPATAGPAGPRATPGGGRTGRHHAAPTSKDPSRLPLILAGAAGGVIVLVIALLLVFSGDSAPAPERANQSPQAPRAPSLAEQIEQLDGEILAHSREAAQLERIHVQAKKLQALGVARKSAEQALRLDDRLAWAHQEMGHVKFDPTGLPDEDAVLYLTPDWDLLQSAQKEGWLTPARQSELAAAKERFAEHMKRLEADGHYKRICMWKGSIAKHPVFAKYEYTTVEEGPYLIFIQKSDDQRKAARLKELALQKAAIYRCLYQTFLDRFGERFKLGPLRSSDFAEDRVLKAWIFADRKSFDEYHQMIGMPVGENVGAYYFPTDQWMIIPDEVAGGVGAAGNQNMDINVSFHEGTHQLVHYYTKRLVERACGEEISWTDSRLDSNSHWFQEGLAEWFGSAVKNGDGWNLFQTNIYRLMHWKSDREGKLEEWNLEDLLAASDSDDLDRRGGRMGALYYGQAWAFISFLWNFEDGKYREKFLTYFGRELAGESGLKVFKEVFGVTEVKGSELEKEYLGYCERLINQTPLPDMR
jgi:hypothetical protein